MPDGATLVTAGTSGNIVLWDVTTRTVRATLTGRTGVKSLVAAPNGERLYALTFDGVAAYDLDAAHWHERLCMLVGRVLTAEEWERHAAGQEPQPVC
jgi:WD40 repeat protein